MLYRLMIDSSGLWVEKPYKIHEFHSNPCTHSLENLGWPSILYQSTDNFMLHGLVTDSGGVVGQKLGVCPEKSYKIHDFYSNRCRHLLENLCWPCKLHRSMQNFMLYPLMIDWRGVVGKNPGFGPKNHTKHMILIVIVADIRLILVHNPLESVTNR